jgi:hypothetical protein
LQSQKALAQEAVNLPLKASQASATLTGSFAICLNTTNFAEEACTTHGAVAFPVTVVSVGYIIGDAQGNSCQTFTQTVSDLPVDISPPFVAAQHSVGRLLNYNPATGSGDAAFIGYSGGQCHGASFDKNGATKVSSGTVHFTVSENGNRVDAVVTKLTDPLNGIGDFSLYGVNRVQVTP